MVYTFSDKNPSLAHKSVDKGSGAMLANKFAFAYAIEQNQRPLENCTNQLS